MDPAVRLFPGGPLRDALPAHEAARAHHESLASHRRLQEYEDNGGADPASNDGRPSILRNKAGVQYATPKSVGLTMLDAFPNLQPRYDLSKKSTYLHVNLLHVLKIPECVFEMHHLTRLDFGMNEILSLSPAIGQLQNLEQLWLNHNPLTTLPPELHLCKKLRVLDVRSTKMVALPLELGRLEKWHEIDVTETPLMEDLKDIYSDPWDTPKLIAHLDLLDKRVTLQAALFEKACAGVYLEIADDPVHRDRISLLVDAVAAAFPEPSEMKNCVRHCDRLLPMDPSSEFPKAAAQRIRSKYITLRRDNDKKRLSAELELKMRALYYDVIDPTRVEHYIRAIYQDPRKLEERPEDASGDEAPLELEDIQFLIRYASQLLPGTPGEITGHGVRSAVWALQQELVDARESCVRAVCAALKALYADAEPPLVLELGRATCKLFERDRFATKKELGELKKLSADASALFPAEFSVARPKKVRKKFKEREKAEAAGAQG